MAEPRRKLHIPERISSAVILCSVTAVFAVLSLFARTDAADQSLWRGLLHAHDRVWLALGSDELGNVYITKERLLRHIQPPEESVLQKSANAVNRFADNAGAPLYLLAVPTSAGIYSDDLADAAPIANEHQILRRFGEMLSDQVSRIEAYSWLSAEREQYIYYRTDSCWTGYGAYCSYRSAIRRLGFPSIGYDQFSVMHCRSDYYGRLAQDVHYYEVQPDLVDMYTLRDQPQNETVTALRAEGAVPLPSYYLTEYADTEPEKIFAAAHEPVLRIETDNQSSKDLLLLSDAFGYSMIPFLTRHYRSVTAVNLPLAKEQGADPVPAGSYSQILLLCGADTLMSPDGLAALLPQSENDT